MTADEAVVFDIDAEAVTEIVGNLLDNAREHAGGRIQGSVGTPAHSFRSPTMAGACRMGPPIRRSNPLMTRSEKGGSGLGLAVSRSLARAHGGDVS